MHQAVHAAVPAHRHDRGDHHRGAGREGHDPGTDQQRLPRQVAHDDSDSDDDDDAFDDHDDDDDDDSDDDDI